MSITGRFLDIDKKDLNSIREFSDKTFSDAASAEWTEYMDYVGTPLYGSEHFRKQAIEAGYSLEYLYPVYHQGWELDEWGAVGTKDGKRFRLETNHGSLTVEDFPSLFQAIKNRLGFGD